MTVRFMPSDIPSKGRPLGGGEGGDGGDWTNDQGPSVDSPQSRGLTDEERQAIDAHYSQLRREAAARVGLSPEDIDVLEERFGGSLQDLITWKKSQDPTNTSLSHPAMTRASVGRTRS
jgi:hypothetical protein